MRKPYRPLARPRPVTRTFPNRPDRSADERRARQGSESDTRERILARLMSTGKVLRKNAGAEDRGQGV